MAYDILVTGGAGYLGSTLVPALLAAGHRVTVLDSFMFRQTSLNHVCHDPNFKVVKGDIRVESIVAPLLKKADIVIPLAALVGAPMCNADPIGAKTINHDAILLMLRLAVAQPAHPDADHQQRLRHRRRQQLLHRGVAAAPDLASTRSEKVAIEGELMQRENAISFRLATVFGMSPRMRIDLLVNDFTYRAVHDRFVVLFEGDFKRNYIHVRDVARVFQHGIENFEAMRGQIYNVGLSEANVSKRELCQHIQKQLPDFVFLDAPVGKDPDQRNYIVSNAKIERTGFKTAVTLDAGIAELIKGFTMVKNTVHGNV